MKASAFFAARAADAEPDAPRATTPADAGTLVVAVRDTLDALATRARTGRDRRRRCACGDLGEPDPDLVGHRSHVDRRGEPSSTQLAAWNVGHLLIGGTRDANGVVQIAADSVTVRDGARLSADEVVLVAGDAIAVQKGATVASTSGGATTALDATRFEQAQTLELGGSRATGAAVLALSDLAYLQVERPDGTPTVTATLDVASGAKLATRGAIALDAAGTVGLGSGVFDAPGASWSLGSRHIVFGDSASAPDGLAIDTSLGTELARGRAVDLRTAGTIDLARATVLGSGATGGLQSLTLSARGIRNLAPDAASRFSAGTITFNGSSGTALPTPRTSGALRLEANDIEVDAGTFGLAGFDTVDLTAGNVVRGTDSGVLTTNADVTVRARALVADGGARLGIDAGTGALRVDSSGAAPAASTLASGGTLALKGADVTVAGALLAPGGVVSLQATRDLRIEASALLDAAGYKPADAEIGPDGGTVSLVAGGRVDVATGARLDVECNRCECRRDRGLGGRCRVGAGIAAREGHR